jgi:hypothetical protein
VTNVPLANVAVAALTTSGAAVTGGTGTTDANGAASLTLPFGVFNITFTATGFTSPTPVQVGVVEGQTVSVSVTMSSVASLKPTLTVTAAGQNIGYGKTVALNAVATPSAGVPSASAEGSSFAFTWANASTYRLSTAAVTGAATGTAQGNGSYLATGSLTTPGIFQANQPEGSVAAGNWISGYAIPATFGMFPVMDDTNGSTTASVTVTDEYGQSVTATTSVVAASFQNGTQNVAVGTRVYLNAGTTACTADPCVLASGTWALTVPNGSSSSFDNTSAQFPSFIPDVAGTYVAKLGNQSISIYAGSWMGMISKSGTTETNTQNGTVPFTASALCTTCHYDTANSISTGPGDAIDNFTPWIGTKHAVHETYGMNGVAGFASGETCLGCHSVGFDPGNTNPIAGGTSQVAAAQTPPWTFPSTPDAGNWASVPAAVAQLANIQCEQCHGPQGGSGGGFSAAHRATDVTVSLPDGGTVIQHQPFTSPRVSYAAEDCGTCHAAGTSHHHYSEWATLNPDDGRGHSNLLIAQSEALTSAPDAGTGVPQYELNSSCGRCHSAEGYTEYVGNLQGGNVGVLSPAQQAAGQVNPNNIHPQTCQSCHDPHKDTLTASGADEYQLRLFDDITMLPAGFGVTGMGAGAVCISCHNSRNGGYVTQAESTAGGTVTNVAYLHEDTDWIGSNPGSSNTALGATYASLGTKFTSLGGPHEANQGDVFEGHNAYFLGDQTPVLSPHSAVKDTCVGCHMENNPGTYTSHGAATTATHLFSITDADVPNLCPKCHATGTTNVDGASLQASVNAGLNTIVSNMSGAVLARVNDSSGKTAPTGYGSWTDSGTINIPAKGLTDTTPGCTLGVLEPSCGLQNATTVTINTTTGNNPAVSAVVTPQGRSGITVVLTFTAPVSITFKGASGNVTNNLTSFTVNLASLDDNSATPVPLFAPNGNMFKANWNWTLIDQDKSLGVHNPPFVSAVLSATADPPGDPWATPPSVPGLWY